ncbi:hypothetical protein VTN77DRAFT_5725 [Rasamsonia byssochlamydoides]|uniref:uncharacterized protein n=1 Tax=Rasamsonia byssochlamydoides TaxID=89139 RepID=UPI0037443A69
MGKTALQTTESEPPKSDNDVTPSEFTTRSILALVGAFGAMFCTVGFGNAFGLFQEYYKNTLLLNESESDISWLGAICIFLLFAGSLFTGPILDLFGPVIMFWLGTLGTVFSMMMTSLCKEFWQFILAQGILLGLSMTLLVCPAVALIGQYFRKQRAAAVGVTIAGSSIGGVLWPIIVHELLQKPNIGFGWTMRISGFIMLVILVVSCIIARPASKPDSPASSSPDAENQHSKPAANRKLDLSIVKTPAMLFTAFGFFLVYFGMFSPFFFVTSYAVEKGFSQNLSFYTISIVNGGSFFGRILPGLVADRYGKFNLCIIMTVLSGIIALCWTTATSVAGLVVFSAAYGFASGGILSLQQSCAAQIATPATIGTSMGVVMAASSLSALAGTPVSRALAGRYGYLALSIYSGVSLLAGASVLVLARLVQNRKLLAVV